MNDSSVIVLEFNELTPHLMEQWMAEGKLPGFKQLHDQASVYVTDAEEPEASLEPWIQWVTVHSGLTFKEHGIYDLGDGHKLRSPRLWDIASEAGKKVWVCGSMNAGTFGEGVNGAILPDPWSTGLKPFPEKDFSHFFRYIQKNVQEYTRSDLPLSITDHLRFGAFMLRNGLSFETIKRTVTQLLSERGGKFHWRRAMILDRLMWDLFRSRWRKSRPHYSTLFLNSTAHLQHYHWRNMDPDSFKLKPNSKEQQEYHDAVLRGYQAMDQIVQEALEMIRLTDSNTNLVMMTALSQQPLTKYEESGGKQLFKANNTDQLQNFAGVENPGRYEPVMAEEFRYVFESKDQATAAFEKLLTLTLDGTKVIRGKQDGTELFLACAIIHPPAQEAMVRSGDGQEARFHDLFYSMLHIKSGRHHPDGMFWLRTADAQHKKVPGKVPLRRTTATLAKLAGLKPEVIKKQFVSPALDEVAGSDTSAASGSRLPEDTTV